MASATDVRATEVVKTAEDIVARAAKGESKAQVTAQSTAAGESRAWDAKAQID